MQGWKKGKEWSDRFIPEIKQICELHLTGGAPVEEASIEEDQKRHTDLIVLKMESLRIACRVRDTKFYIQYPDEITIRSIVPSGAKTELQKVIEGWGDYMFYGFSNEDETELCAWKLCDLNVFRLWLSKESRKYKSSRWNVDIDNNDGTFFRAYNTNVLPGNFIFQCSPDKTKIFSTANIS